MVSAPVQEKTCLVDFFSFEVSCWFKSAIKHQIAFFMLFFFFFSEKKKLHRDAWKKTRLRRREFLSHHVVDRPTQCLLKHIKYEFYRISFSRSLKGILISLPCVNLSIRSSLFRALKWKCIKKGWSMCGNVCAEKSNFICHW